MIAVFKVYNVIVLSFVSHFHIMAIIIFLESPLFVFFLLHLSFSSST